MEFREKNHSTRLVRTCDCPVDTRPAQAHNRGAGGRGVLLGEELADVQLKPDLLVRFPGRDQIEDG